MDDRVESGRVFNFYRSEITSLSIAKIYTRYASAPEAGKLGLRERESFLSESPGRPEISALLFREDGAWEITYKGPRRSTTSVTRTSRTPPGGTFSTFCDAG